MDLLVARDKKANRSNSPQLRNDLNSILATIVKDLETHMGLVGLVLEAFNLKFLSCRLICKPFWKFHASDSNDELVALIISEDRCLIKTEKSIVLSVI